MCAFKAFDEYLKDLATATDRTLVVPDRFSFVNFTATALPWQRCLREHQSESSRGSKQDSTMGRVMLTKNAEWPLQQCKGSMKFIKLTRCRRGGCSGVPAGISLCEPQLHGVDRCLILNGLVHLKGLLGAVPEFSDPNIPCVTVTQLARGVLVSPNSVVCSGARWNPLRHVNEMIWRADEWLTFKGLRTPKFATLKSMSEQSGNVTDVKANYIAAQFRTEKWPAAVASSERCWASIAAALARAANASKVSDAASRGYLAAAVLTRS